MLARECDKAVSRQIGIVAAVLFLGMACAPRVTLAATLNELVANARKESALSATVTASMTGRAIPSLAAAFKKRFGLDIDVTLTAVSDVADTPKAVAETKAGVVPTYDAVEGADVNKYTLLEAGGLQRIDGWQSLLAEINPLVRSGKVRPEQVSPAPLSGYGFMFASRVGALLYNSRLISKGELPKTHAELGDPKYKGRWTQPPWTSDWDIAPLIFPDLDKGRWLEVVRKAGKNAGAVQAGQAGIQRLLLGEFVFALGNSYYAAQFKSKDPQAPLEIAYFQDYNWSNYVFYSVRKGTRRPAAATLFSFWMTTPEAESIWQPDLFLSHFLWGESELDKKEKQLIQDSGAKITDFLSTEQGRDLLAWYSTEEGRKYRQAMGKAIRGE